MKLISHRGNISKPIPNAENNPAYPRLWCHAKNLEALRIMLNLKVQCFWHQEDDYTVTNTGWIWAYPNKPGNIRTIAVLPELEDTDVTGFAGVCSDYIERYVEK